MKFHLRDLPLPAKLVVSVFLLAVGLGYFSAMVQLHLNHSNRDGNALPTPSDVVAVFAGLEPYKPPKPGEMPVSRLETIIMADRAGDFSKTNMSHAFFEKTRRGIDDDNEKEKYDKHFNYKIRKEAAGGDDAKIAQLDAERDGERQAIVAWTKLEENKRKLAYDSDHLAKPETVKSITPGFLKEDVIAVKSILTQRCTWCHCESGDKSDVLLVQYSDMKNYLANTDIKPEGDAPAPGTMVKSARQMNITQLTKSTHAHLLSFAMLFGLTGFVFAFTSYTKPVRLLIAPVVLLAQVADVSCWWLARIPDVGMYFAYAIIGTGTVVGLGLAAQIILSLFDMYGRRGKLVLIALFAVAAGGFSVLYTKAIEPGLQAEKQNAKEK